MNKSPKVDVDVTITSRGGSKGIPKKYSPFLGVPLVSYLFGKLLTQKI